MKNIITLLRQLNIIDFFRIGLLEFFRKLLNIDIAISYGQNGEDRLLMTLLDVSKPGFYVEVGSNDPIHFSNTFALYCRGWRGIAIDPNATLIAKHKTTRPNDIALCCAISNREMEFDYVEYESNEMNTISSDRKILLNKMGLVPKKIAKIVATTLNNVLSENMPENTKIDLLSIDAEGHDYDILLSIDLINIRPRLIVVEMHNFDLTKPQSNLIYSYMEKYNYKLVAFVKWNGFFLEN